MTLSEQIAAAITAQEAEIERIRTQAQRNLQDAQQRLALLQQAQGLLTPAIEKLLAKLAAIGVGWH